MFMLKSKNMHADINTSKRFAFSLLLIYVRNLLLRFSSSSSADTYTLIGLLTLLFNLFSLLRMDLQSDASDSA